MFSFESQLIKTDVTAVKILKIYYLIGVGGYLHVFDKSSNGILTKLNIFEGQKIYGIIPNKEENKILLYGGKHMKVILIDKNFKHVEESACKISYDWILTAKWIESDHEIATVSMHNTVQIWSQACEIIAEIKCEEKCILYSAFICYNDFKDLVILSGTVFSEVLIWRPDKERDSSVLHRLQRHKGVIFSIHYNDISGYICSSSDDRSTVLWKPQNDNLLFELEQKNININVSCHVFGHLSRVFRCHVLKDCFVTAGEDSFLNIWTFDGILIRKIETHQGGPIWAIDASENDNILTGGSDCGAILFSINCDYDEEQLSLPNKNVPKSVGHLIGDNLISFSENGFLYYYIRNNRQWLQIQEHHDLKSYALLEVSKCRNLVALAGFHGQIYIYKQENNTLTLTFACLTKTKSRIFALHWLNCSTFTVCESEGKMTVYSLKDDKIVPISNFLLPPSKERWSTTAIFANDKFVIGDRKGNLHLFQLGQLRPVQSLKKVHSHLGVTNLILANNEILSLGRNATIKKFILTDGVLQLVSSNKVPFTWLVDIIGDLLLAFSGDKFILWNCSTNRILFEISCGGGHRSWDFLIVNDKAFFCFIKDKSIHTVNLNWKDLFPIDLIKGYQIREINSIEAIKVFDDYILVSGGEDTSLRLNLVKGNNFSDLVSLKPHLSSIRTITSYKISESDNGSKTYLVFSGGGRAQIICWKLDVHNKNNSVKDVVFSEQHSYYKNIDCEESETRIMDLQVVDMQDNLLLLAACSDGNIKVFLIVTDSSGKYFLQFFRDIFYKLKCILKLCCFNIFSKNVLVTMATDGKLVFWDISNIFQSKSEINFFYSIESHQSGINSFTFRKIKEHLYLFLTGGDDNAIVLNLLNFQNTSGLSGRNIDIFTDSGKHCAQITGVFLSDKYFFSSSIDQKVAIFEWQLINDKITCRYITRYNTAVADLQGLCCFEDGDFDLFIYGKGLEYMKIKRT